MADTTSSEASVLARRAAAVAQILETLANARRLVVRCPSTWRKCVKPNW
jgi:hypothetical protein